MYGIYADQLGCFGGSWGVNVGIYSIHGVYGLVLFRVRILREGPLTEVVLS